MSLAQENVLVPSDTEESKDNASVIPVPSCSLCDSKKNCGSCIAF